MARAADGQPAGRRPHRPAGAGVPPKVGQAEREVIKAALQLPEVVAEQFDQLGPQAFLTAVHQQLQAAIAAAGGAAAGRTGPAWVERVAEHLPPDSEARAAVNALAVEPLRSGTDAQSRYAEAMVVQPGRAGGRPGGGPAEVEGAAARRGR